MCAQSTSFANPFRPGAGHMPPFLAGRKTEEGEFRNLLKQDTITQNLILTGLRGIGKTVLLETLKPVALKEGWLWAGTDLSESVSLKEETLATRLLADLALATSSIVASTSVKDAVGFIPAKVQTNNFLNYQFLAQYYAQIPGLTSDKLKAVLEFVWEAMKPTGKRGIVFAYDEAQNLADHAARNEYPLSLLLDVFQSIQRKNIRFMLVLTGLPTLFPKLVDSRTYSERMFHQIFLKKLGESDAKEAIEKPIKMNNCPVRFDPNSVTKVYELSGGYPYFIQFICKEVYDVWVVDINAKIPVAEITQRLDTDFFAGRWARVTDRHKQLLTVAAKLESAEEEFTVQEIVEKSKEVLNKPFTSSHVGQILASLINMGLIYKNRHGKYLFAVPLLSQFILRQETM